MNRAPDPSSGANPGLASWYVPGKADGFGDRLQMYDNAGTPSLELLRFHADIALAAGFEESLRERVRELRSFRHPSFATVRSVQHLEGDGLTLVSAFEPGQRLSELFDQKPHKSLHPNIVTWMLKELTPALVALHEQGPNVAHGALTPDRIVLSPEGRLRIVEHVMGSALSQLRRPPSRLWREFGLLAPQGTVATELDARTDIVQLAGVALSMLLTRRLTLVDIEQRLPELLEEAGRSSGAVTAPRIEPLRVWLGRALQLSDPVYHSAADAIDDLKELSTSDQTRVAVPAAAAPETSTSVEVAPPAPPATAPTPSAGTATRDARRSPPAKAREPIRTEVAPLPEGDWSPASAFEAFTREQRPQPRPQRPAPRLRTPAVPVQPPPSRPTPPPAEPAPRPQSEATVPPPVAAKPGSNVVHARLDSFQTQPSAEPRQQNAPRSSRRAGESHGLGPRLSIALCAVVVFEAAVIMLLVLRTPPVPVAPTVTIEAAAGETVLVNGQRAGTAPLQLQLDRNVHSLGIQGAVPAPSDVPPAASEGARGTEGGGQNLRGFVRFASDVDLRVLHRGVTVGRTSGGSIVLPVGLQRFELVNDETGFREGGTVNVRAGEERTVRVPRPAR